MSTPQWSYTHHNNDLSVGPVGINRRARILPGISNHQIELKAFQGNIMDQTDFFVLFLHTYILYLTDMNIL